MNIPFELVEQFARGNGVIVVGAGLSQGAGLPGWDGLLSSLADRLGLPQPLRTNPLKVAQYYDVECGRQALVSYISEQLDTTGKGPTHNHRRLIRLNARTWVTTNYDDLIERTFYEAGERFAKVVRDADLPYTSTDTTTLVKLHGDLEQKDTIVITQQDYNTYFRRFPRIKEKLAGLLLEKTLLFVGYSVSDPDFNQIHDEIAFDLEQHQRTAYAVLFDADALTVSELRSRNIQVLNIAAGAQQDYSPRLGELLDTLIQEIARAQGHRTQKLTPSPTGSPPPDSRAVRGLLEAMGYRIVDMQSAGSDLYFLCDAKWGAEVRQEVVHFVSGTPTAGAIAALNDAVNTHNAARGTLLTQTPLPENLCALAQQRQRVECYTLEAFTQRLADFRPYLESLIKEYEASEIPRYYVPLTARSEANAGQEACIFKPLTTFIDAWIDEPGRNHLSILGDFGSGKTWLCQHYAYLVAKRHLADPTHTRIPILISLRNYSRAYDVEQLITDAVANRYGVGLAAGYQTFARLNEAGRLLIIFDGFDEMERRVSDYRTTVENFWELSKVVCPGSKVLLTCRTAYFRHQSEEEKTLAPQRPPVSITAGEQLIALHDQERFQVLHLQEFSDAEILLAVQKRLPVGWKPVYEQIQQLANLRDLASRPVLLAMIVQTLPQIQDQTSINQATLYEAYINRLLRRRDIQGNEYIAQEERLFFMQELAWEMYITQRFTISFSEFPARVIAHFGLKDAPENAAFFERDVRTQSYLVRDAVGNYKFAHKSFMEYFVARKMCTALENTALAFAIWRVMSLSQEIKDFLTLMIADPHPLWELIHMTRGLSPVEVGYTGGNALTVLHNQGAVLRTIELANTILVGAQLARADMSNANLSGANLNDANLSQARLRDADLRGASLVKTQFHSADLTAANLTGTNCSWTDFQRATLDKAIFLDARCSAYFGRAAVQGTDFRGADLSGSDWGKQSESVSSHLAARRTAQRRGAIV